MPRELVLYPDPILRKKSKPVKNIDGYIDSIIKDMLYVMNSFSHCIGIAAPQLGVLKRIIVVDVSKNKNYRGKTHGLIILINPEIIEVNGEKIVREGCLSIPDFVGYVKRPKKITVRGIDPDGKEIFIETKGLEAVAIVHEIDHLDGILFIDRISSIKDLIPRSQLSK